MSAFSHSLGLNAKLYQAAAAFTAANEAAVTGATLTEITRVKDVTISGEHQETDTTTRDNDGWDSMAPTLKSLTIECDLITRPSDARYLALRDAWINKTPIGIVALTGAEDVPGEDGPAGNFFVMSMTREEQLTEAVRVALTLRSYSYMQWFTVPT